MHQTTRPAIGDIVVSAVPLRYGVNGHLSTIQPATLGHVSRHLEPDIVEVDFGQEGTRPVHVAVLDVLELPEDLDLDYLGDTVIEFALRAVEAYLEQRRRADIFAAVCDGYAHAARRARPVLARSRLAHTTSGPRHNNGSRS